MTEEEFRLLRDRINDYCGIRFSDDARALVERRLAPRLEALGLRDYTEYYHHLRYSPERRAELEEVVERVSTNETYFFREQYQLTAFQQELLPDLALRKPRGRRLAVWSAGCATGEEAYTIAILILESGLFAGWDVRVFGNDISRRVLQVARRGRYGRSSFRQTDEPRIRRWFRAASGEPEAGGDPARYEVGDEVKALVSFGQINLLEREMLALVGEVDVVFCRNVLMYFDSGARKKVVDAFHEKLVPGGHLLLGHSESLINLSTAFELLHLRNDMVYRKPIAGDARATPGGRPTTRGHGHGTGRSGR